MEELPQLFMRKKHLDDLPELSRQAGTLPAGVSLHTHRAGDEAAWERIIERSFGSHYSFEDWLPRFGVYDPSYVFYLTKDGIDVATTSAVEQANFSGEGWLHMVGADPAAQGLGLSRHVVLAALYSFYARGYQSVVLSTDDFRIPAICTYLRLGFEPVMSHESHPARWEEIYRKIGC